MKGIKNFLNRNNEDDASLDRYFSVVRSELPPKFQICKKVPVETELSSSEDELWEEHETSLDELKDLSKKLDEGELNLSEIESVKTSLLDLKLELAERILESCHFCERHCEVDRKKGERGACGVGKSPKIASEFIHMGEEPELIPSFTIFFSGCTFKCQFCQNWDISQNPNSGIEYSPGDIASLISEKGKGRARNVNWVGGDPTPNLHNVLATLKECEVDIPSVWNSNMYVSERGMWLLSGTQDVYLTDFKYGNDECASKYSMIPNYWRTVTRNHKIGFFDAELIIRHLVLPEHLECCTRKILNWIHDELHEDVRVNIMSQYRPQAQARNYPELSKRVSPDEMNKAFRIAEEIGLKNIVK